MRWELVVNVYESDYRSRIPESIDNSGFKFTRNSQYVIYNWFIYRLSAFVSVFPETVVVHLVGSTRAIAKKGIKKARPPTRGPGTARENDACS